MSDVGLHGNRPWLPRLVIGFGLAGSLGLLSLLFLLVHSWIAHGISTTTIQTRTVSDVSGASKAAAAATSEPTGQWGSLMNWPVVGMHGELLPDGNILTWGDSSQGDTAVVWDPTTNTSTSIPDPFANPSCGGNNILPDGRVITVGGGGVSPADANTNITGYSETNQAWGQLASNAFPTWYASTTVLSNGNLLRLGGVDGCDNCNPEVPEEFSPATNQWTTLSNNPTLLPMYPFTYVRPNGTVAVTGSSLVKEPLMIYDPTTETWTTSDPNVVDGGSSAMYDTGKVIKAGSSYTGNALSNNPSAATAYTTDLSQATPTWTQTGSMAYPRSYLNLTPLPDGTVLATGGGTTTNGGNLSDGVLPAEDWNPATGQWTTWASMAVPRLYHSIALLMPDGRVFVAGTGDLNGVPNELNYQIFSPPYLFNGPRPTITSSPSVVQYGSNFQVSTPDAASITSVSLIRPAAVTHSFDQSARRVSLPFTVSNGTLNVQAPANGGDAPPGPYMLFIVNSNGVPSVASWVNLPAPYQEDTTPPSAPSGLTATATNSSSVSLSWTASTDNVGVTGYTIFRNGTKIGTTTATSYTDNSVASNTQYTYTVAAYDAVGNTSTPSSAATVRTPVEQCPCSIWQDGTPTGSVDAADTSAVTLGVQFQAASSGYITGVRFYKESDNTGAHTGSLWTASGTLLATGTFSNETASGWQELDFSSPVPVTAGTTYVASYFTSAGHYAATQQGLASAVANGPLTALAGGGVYAYGSASTFPTGTYLASNYWVDVVYSTSSGATVPGAPSGVSATASNGSASVSWTAPGSGGSAITGYTVTPYIGSTAQTPTTVTGSPPATTATVTGLTNGTSYTFTVSATNAVGTGAASSPSNAVTPNVGPAVSAVTPACGATGVAVSVAPSVTFSQAVTPSTVSFTVVDSGGNSVAGSVGFSGGNTVATFTPTNALAAGVTYTATVSGAQNASGTSMGSPYSWSFTTAGPTCPCSIWQGGSPTGASDAPYTDAITLGVQFQASSSGYIDGVRFYKESDNTGAHTGSLWTASGTLLASGTFSGETASGWQELDFSAPVPVTAGTTYVASYFTSAGHWAATNNGLASAVANGPLTALAGGGVFTYGSSSTFPSSSYQASNYWVDVVYSPPAGATPPAVTTVTPGSGATGVAVSVAPTATFSQPVTPSTVSFTVKDSANNTVNGTVSFNAADTVATFTPSSPLAASTTYTATVSGAQNASGTPMASPYSWSFTTGAVAQCPCSIWQDGTPTGSVDAADTSAVTLGVQFQAASSGYITGVRFYKESDNTGAHTGSLWTASGTLLATGTFSNETASGWQELDFSSPVPVTAGTTYVASYFTSAGHYAATQQGLASAVANGPLTALAGGGVYAYGSASTFPTGTYLASNYWVDVVYSTSSGATVPGAPSGVSATASNGSASVSWTAPGSGGSAITGYTVTPYIGSTAQTPTTVTGSPPATTATVTGLTNGTSYTFTVSATNAVGTGAASSPSNAVTPNVGPAVSAVTPAGGATGVAVSVAPSVTFSQAVTPSTVSFTVVDSGGNSVAGSVGFSGGNTVATFTPTNALAAGVTYTATVSGAQNASGTSMGSPYSWSFTTAGPTCPCSIWQGGSPTGASDAPYTDAITLGVQFQASSSGYIDGVRFYKESDNTGAHTGSLWTASGTLLASGTFSGETASGWQELDFSAPVPVTAGTTYVASYFTSAGHWAATNNGLASAVANGPLTALAGGGVFTYGSSSTFPSSSYQASNYWVDVVYSPPAGATPPAVTTVTPGSGATGVAVSVAPTATFSQPVTPSTVSFTVKDSANNTVNGTVSFNAADTVATFTPSSPLAASTTYTATVSGAQNASGTPMASPYSWSFTTGAVAQCPCSIWQDGTPTGSVDAADTSAVTLGVQFQAASSGYITGVRFYKESDNTGAHTGSLWTASGTLLATGTFSNETASGWQELDFSSPVPVTAGTTYVASYFTSAGHYAATQQGLASAVANGPLTALAGGGVYAYGSASTFPTGTYLASNYWVDVVYSPS